MFFTAVLLHEFAKPARAEDYLGPDNIVASQDGKWLYVACKDSLELVVVDAAGGAVVKKIELPARPTGLALSADGSKLYVTCTVPGGAICVVHTASRKIAGTVPSSLSPHAPVLAPDGKRLYVCNRFENDVSAIDLESGKTVARTPATREPTCAAATPDGKTVFAANLVPNDRADSEYVGAVVTAVDAATAQATAIRLPLGSTSVRGLCVSPDGKYVYAVHAHARYQLPTTQVERGWSNTAMLSIIDAAVKKLVYAVPLDDADLGAADPWGVATTADGKWICITYAGTHELSLIDAARLFEKLSKHGSLAKEPIKAVAMATSADVENDFTLLLGVRRRIKLDGNGPHGLAVVGSLAYVTEYFSDTIAVVDIESDPPKVRGRIALGPPPKLSASRRGKLLFNDATLCFQQWQSCASCHPDARTDGMNWDLLNDGMGNPKNAKSLINVHEVGPVMSLGVRQSAKVAVEAGIRRVMFAEPDAADVYAIDQYLYSLSPVPSPRLIDGELSPAARRGKKIFFDREIGCARCHPEPFYTDKKAHDVASVGPLDKPDDKFQTPQLIELWRTAPYLHDGRYLTVKELFVEGKHGAMGSKLESLSEKEIDDLVEFLLSL